MEVQTDRVSVPKYRSRFIKVNKPGAVDPVHTYQPYMNKIECERGSGCVDPLCIKVHDCPYDTDGCTEATGCKLHHSIGNLRKVADPVGYQMFTDEYLALFIELTTPQIVVVGVEREITQHSAGYARMLLHK